MENKANGGSDKGNRLANLNDKLFVMLDRLSDQNLKGETLRQEINRAKTISFVASQIIGTATLAMKAQEFVVKNKIKNPPALLGIGGYEGKEEK